MMKLCTLFMNSPRHTVQGKILPQPYTADGIRCAERRYPPNSGMDTHAHEEAGFVLVLSGSAEIDYQGKTHRNDPGSLTYLPPFEPHANRFLGGLSAFEIMIGVSWLDRLRQVHTADLRPFEFRNAPVVQVATRLRHEIGSPDMLTNLAVEGLVTDLLIQTIRAASPVDDRKAPMWLRRTKDYLHANYAQDLSLQKIAAEIGVHPAHLTRAFRRHFHTSVAEYVRRLRIDAACRLLATTEAPIAQIALDLGFADQGHFTRRFKALLGVTPKAFRDRSQNARIG